MDQIALAVQDAIHCVGDLAPDLAHPQSVGGGGDTRNLDLARRQIEEEQHYKALESFWGPDFHGGEIGRHDQFPVPGQKLRQELSHGVAGI